MKIREGIKNGDFGIGYLNESGELICKDYNEEIEIDPSSVLVSAKISTEQTKPKEPKVSMPPIKVPLDGPGKTPDQEKEQPGGEGTTSLRIQLSLPRGKVSQLMGVMNFLQSKFELMQLEIEVSKGGISKAEYEEKIIEAFRQIGINIKSDFKE